MNDPAIDSTTDFRFLAWEYFSKASVMAAFDMDDLERTYVGIETLFVEDRRDFVLVDEWEEMYPWG